MIESQRHLFDIPDDVVYLNCAYMAPQLKSVTQAGVHGVGRKSSPWEITPEDFFEKTETARAAFATLIGANSDDVALVPSVSYGIGVAATNLTVAKGDRIVVLDEQFPSNYYPWLTAAKDNEATLKVVERPDQGAWTDAVIEAIDARTAVVALPNVHWTDGHTVDLCAIAEQCRSAGAALVLDLTQSVGAVPLDLETIRPDFVACAGYKWLLGPYSLGYLYVREDHQSGAPFEHGWLNRKDSDDFAGLVNYTDVFLPGARRFDVGEHSNFALMPMAVAALEQILAWGVTNIANTLKTKTRIILRKLDLDTLQLLPESARAPHILGLRFRAGVPDHLAAELRANNIHVSIRGDSMRVSPHLYNTDDDLERFVAVLSQNIQ